MVQTSELKWEWTLNLAEEVTKIEKRSSLEEKEINIWGQVIMKAELGLLKEVFEM